MQLEPEITFRDIEGSPAVEAKVRERLERLERHHPGIMGCRVVIEAHHRHRHQGKLFHVRVDLTVPGHELVVSRDPEQHQAHEDAYVAVRDAFDAMERQLDGLRQRQQREVKVHATPPHGHVQHLAPDHGRILSADGRSIYFHRNSVTGDRFDQLDIGTEVRFVESAGDEGPQASTVVAVGKHHIVGD